MGSITKTFAATAAMRLVEEGRLDLDRSLQSYLPDLRLADPDVAATVTPRHLLTHTAGWVGYYFSDTGRGDDVGVSQAHTPVVAVSGDVLGGCVGLYQSPLEDVEIGRVGEALVARAISRGGFPTRTTPPLPEAVPRLIRLGFYAQDRLVGLDPPFLDTRCELIRGPDGSVAWLRFGSRIHRRIH